MLKKIGLFTLAMTVATIASAYADNVLAVVAEKDSAGIIAWKEHSCVAGIINGYEHQNLRERLAPRLEAKESTLRSLCIVGGDPGKRLVKEEGFEEELLSARVANRNVEKKIIEANKFCAELAQMLFGPDRCGIYLYMEKI